MMEHFTRNTIEASAWCPKCGKNTQHRVDGVKLGPCIDCLTKAMATRPTAKPADRYPQAEMFANNGRREK